MGLDEAARHMWLKCKRCDLHKTRKNVILGRGNGNCDIMFLWEAPDKAEDVLGRAYLGPASKLLETMIKTAIEWAGLENEDYPLRIYRAYACACRPCDPSTKESREPDGEELWACHQRLEWECKKIANPKKVIFLGSIAKLAGKDLYRDALCFTDPWTILRMGGEGCPLAIKFTRDLSQVLKGLHDDRAQEERTKNVTIGRLEAAVKKTITGIIRKRKL